MIDLYYWTTPNGHKITLFLEEASLPYRIVPINIGKGEQFQPDFLKIAPNNRIPAIVDTAPTGGGEPISVFESGAILLYLAEKTGRFLSADPRQRIDTLQWLFWQMGGLGPMAGQNHHFTQYAPEVVPYAIERYVKETARLYSVLDKRLAGLVRRPVPEEKAEDPAHGLSTVTEEVILRTTAMEGLARLLRRGVDTAEVLLDSIAATDYVAMRRAAWFALVDGGADGAVERARALLADRGEEWIADIKRIPVEEAPQAEVESKGRRPREDAPSPFDE